MKTIKMYQVKNESGDFLLTNGRGEYSYNNKHFFRARFDVRGRAEAQAKKHGGSIDETKVKVVDVYF